MESCTEYAMEKKRGFYLDPRTKLLFMVVVVTLLFVAHDSVVFVCVLTGIPLVLLLTNHQWKTATIYGVLFVLSPPK